ncbi:M-domain domain-containing protein [Aphelenchoides besseyi]|nr:M-domain domain-containing protein [Aphelenchoides besseyi]
MMLFTEEPTYFNGTNEGNASGSSGTPNTSKLTSWSGSKRKESSNEDDSSWDRQNSSERVPWSDPLEQAPGSLENEFAGLGLAGQQKPHWSREVNQQTPWEIERQGFAPEAIPSNGPPRFMQPLNMDNGTGHWRSWDHDGGFQKEFHGAPGGFPPMGIPNKMPGQFYGNANNFVPNFNDRMMRNGPPHLAAQQQHPPWMGDKFGGPQGASGRGGFPHNQHSAFSGPPQSAGPLMGPQRFIPHPPPLGAAPQAMGAGHHQGPPHHHGGPHPPPMHPLAATQKGPNDMGGNFIPNYGVHGQGNFDVGTFKAPANMVNDDAVWHDPNGYLRKWQRDTGTSAWGDPTKQAGQTIRRWQNVDENDPLGSGAMPIGSSSSGMQIGPIGSNGASSGGQQQSSPDSLKKEDDEIQETGWGELPPLLNGSSSVPAGQSMGSGMMAPGPPPGPPPMAAGHQQNQPWMSGNPTAGPMNPQPSIPQSAVSGWADSQQRSLGSNNFMPPNNPFPPSNFYAGNAAMPPGSEWGRPPFAAPGTPFEVSNGGSGSTNEIADKLRLAASKGLINPVLFCNSGKLSSTTATLLNTMINLLTEVEQQDLRIEHMKRNGAVGSPEFERLVRETSDAKNQLSDLRDKIHASIDGRPKGVSLADELTDINAMPMGSDSSLFMNYS